MHHKLTKTKDKLEQKGDTIAASAMELVISLYSDAAKEKVDEAAADLFHLLAQKNGFSWGSYFRKLQNIARLAWRG